jgi:multidrug efflux system membrane fusion protein
MGLTNVEVMIPFVRTVEEGKQVIELLREQGLVQGENGLRVIMMCELPSNALLADQFLDIFDGFSIGSNDLTQLTLGLDSLNARIESAQAAVTRAQTEIDRLQIVAPFDGVLETDTAELGSLMQPGGLCATVIQLDPIKVVGFVPETEIGRVEVGAMAGARLSEGPDVQARVTFLSRSADPTTRTFRVELTVPNPDLAIRDGQTAEILIQSQGVMAHLLAASSLTLDDNGTLGVRIIDADSTAQFRPVTVLRDTPQGVYVTGLADQADIITVGQEFVTDGVLVAPSFEEVIQ